MHHPVECSVSILLQSGGQASLPRPCLQPVSLLRVVCTDVCGSLPEQPHHPVTIETDQWRTVTIVGNVCNAVEDGVTAVFVSTRCHLQAVCVRERYGLPVIDPVITPPVITP